MDVLLVGLGAAGAGAGLESAARGAEALIVERAGVAGGDSSGLSLGDGAFSGRQTGRAAAEG